MTLNVKKDNDVLMVSAEIDKLAKVGGLADVVYNLSKALIEQGVNVGVIIPYYESMSEKIDSDNPSFSLYETLNIDFGGNTWIAKIYKTVLDTIPVYIVKNDFFFSGDQYGSVYVDSQSLNHGPFEDDAKRFAFFSTVVAELLCTDKLFKKIQIVHCHDWHTGTLILNLKENKKYKKLFSHIRILYTIHNLDYQGVRPYTLGSTYFGSLSSFKDWLPDFYKDLKKNKHLLNVVSDTRSQEPCYNPMRTAINLADSVNTVSPTYMKEILKPDNLSANFVGGRSLESDLRLVSQAGKLYGVLNGCNYEQYDPMKLEPPFGENVPDWQSVKAQHKAEFLSQLPEFLTKVIQSSTDKTFSNSDKIAEKLKSYDKSKWQSRLLVVMVARIVDQKVKMLTEKINGVGVLDLLLKKNLSLMVIGLGNMSEQMEAINNYENAFYFNTFNGSIANKLYVTGDVFLMPSDFEPCGISQMIAMSYGTLPLVNKIGGLSDTVNDMYNGFVFHGENRVSTAFNMVREIEQIISYCNDRPDDWKVMQDNAIKTRFLWSDCAKKYMEIYKTL